MQEQKGKYHSSKIDDLIQLQQKRLQIVMQRVKAQIMAQFKAIKKNIELQKECLNGPQIQTQQLLTISLPFSDRSRHLRQKLNNTLPYKQIMMNSQMELAKQCQMNKDQQKQAKSNFDLICNYKQRQIDKISGKNLYSEDVCRHLVRKTFKKTAQQIYEVISSIIIKVKENQQVKVACIGGGPGSDLCGIVSYLLQLKIRNLKGVIYDYNYEKWSAVANKLAMIMSKEAKKFNVDMNLNVEWKFIDMTDDSSKQLQQLIKLQPRIVSCCWALNQDLFMKSFWLKLIQRCPETYFIFLDGNRFPLENLLEVNQNRIVDYSSLQSPRVMIIYPNS